MQIDRLILPNILHILLQRQIFNIIIKYAVSFRLGKEVGFFMANKIRK